MENHMEHEAIGRAHMRARRGWRGVAGLCVALGLAAAQPALALRQPAARPEVKTADPAMEVVARVNDVAITRAQRDAARTAANLPDTPASRQAVTNQLIARELFRQAAERQHYDTRPQVVAAVEQAKSAAMIAAWLRDQVKPAPVTDADVKARYDAVVGTLGDTEYKASAIVLADQAGADTVLTQLRNGGDFARLAQQYSQGPTAAQGGALDWVSFRTPLEPGRTQNWPQPLAEALVALPAGALTAAPVAVDGRYWILRVDAKRPTQVPAFDAVKGVLRQQLEQAALETATAQIVVDLLKRARIQQ
jgi:peptidyl-prolyl cis-trans isomerase C